MIIRFMQWCFICLGARRVKRTYDGYFYRSIE
jgi:hypothetical protein